MTLPKAPTEPKPPRGYFGNITDTVVSTAKGMALTFRYLFRKKVTVQYPEVRPQLDERYRGIHYLEQELCINCDKCAKACPVDCIYIEKSAPRKVDKETGKATGGELLRYAIDYQKCMFCGLCTEPCPTDCIHMGKNHDLSSYSREEMVVEFAELHKKTGQLTPLPLWAERNADKIPWVKAEKERIERGESATHEADIPSV